MIDEKLIEKAATKYSKCSNKCSECKQPSLLTDPFGEIPCTESSERKAFIAGAEFMKKEMELDQRFITVEEELPLQYARILIKTTDSHLYIGIYCEKKDYCKWFEGNEPDIDFQIEGEVVSWKYLEY